MAHPECEWQNGLVILCRVLPFNTLGCATRVTQEAWAPEVKIIEFSLRWWKHGLICELRQEPCLLPSSASTPPTTDTQKNLFMHALEVTEFMDYFPTVITLSINTLQYDNQELDTGTILLSFKTAQFICFGMSCACKPTTYIDLCDHQYSQYLLPQSPVLPTASTSTCFLPSSPLGCHHSSILHFWHVKDVV